MFDEEEEQLVRLRINVLLFRIVSMFFWAGWSHG